MPSDKINHKFFLYYNLFGYFLSVNLWSAILQLIIYSTYAAWYCRANDVFIDQEFYKSIDTSLRLRTNTHFSKCLL